MENLSKFKKLLKEIMSQEPKPTLSEEEIQVDVLAMKVMELSVIIELTY